MIFCHCCYPFTFLLFLKKKIGEDRLSIKRKNNWEREKKDKIKQKEKRYIYKLKKKDAIREKVKRKRVETSIS